MAARKGISNREIRGRIPRRILISAGVFRSDCPKTYLLQYILRRWGLCNGNAKGNLRSEIPRRILISGGVFRPVGFCLARRTSLRLRVVCRADAHPEPRCCAARALPKPSPQRKGHAAKRYTRGPAVSDVLPPFPAASATVGTSKGWPRSRRAVGSRTKRPSTNR